jgi:tetratricopeptide (TPR) repeat protein
MAFDLYSPCPCGSGKKFKWCCQPIHVQIDKAFRKDEEGQHEVALRLMEEVTTEHSGNPEAWGRRAQLLYQNGRMDEAENALQKALEINPNYPFGHLLRGMFRHQEGEISGALLLFRRASELYDPEARDVLAQAYSLIADCEMRLGRPVAAQAALRISMRLRPDEDMRQGMEEAFGEKSQLPAAARREYTFMNPPAASPAGQSAARAGALSAAATGKLSDAARAFEQLTANNPEEAADWFNLGLARAWLGDNRGSLEALDCYVRLEPDEARAAAAWALAEVLRFGQGMDDQSDYVEHSALFEIREPQRFLEFLQEWQKERRLVGVQVREEERLVSGVVLDRAGLVTAGAATGQAPKLGAYLLIAGKLVRLWSTNSDALDRARLELQERAGPALSEARLQRGPANFGEMLADALVFPLGAVNKDEAEKLVREHVHRYFEEAWIHKPLRSLNQVPPIDAAGRAELRKKLMGVVQFLQDCSAGAVRSYDFDRLRRKLGLLPGGPAEGGAGPADIGAMSAAELAAVQPDTLTDEQVDQAYQAAQKLDTHELADRFAKALLDRSPRADKSDRFPVYSYLVQRALLEGNMDAALDYVNDGEKADCEHNEGRRRNDYELRRGQVLTKRGETESARDVFERLIDRAPSELRYRGTAAESMLSMKQGAVALRFAEGGLAKAREKNDRDSEQYFMELVAAARKQAG